jgi:tetratricopeptide (TPR) repeat protein
MNDSQSASTTEAIPETVIPLENQIVRRWEAGCFRMAAARRLELARRYQSQSERLDGEFTNLRASQSWLANQDGDEEAKLLLAYVEALAPYLRQRGLNGELLRWCEDGLRAGARLRQNLGWLLLLRSEAQNALGQWDEAMDSIRMAVEASYGKDPQSHSRALLALGSLQLNQGDYKVALETLAQAERLLSEQSNYEGVATVRSQIAAYHLNRRELDKALSLYMEVDQLRRRTGAAEASDHTLLMLGVVYRKKRLFEQSITHLQQLLERGEKNNNRGAMATAAHHLAWVHLDQHNLTEAQQLCGRAIELYTEIGDLRGLSDAYEQLGMLSLAQGRGKDALPYLEQSLDMRRRLGNRHGSASSLRYLAIAHFRLGHPSVAIWYLRQTLSTYQRLGMLNRRQAVAILRKLLVWLVGKR